MEKSTLTQTETKSQAQTQLSIEVTKEQIEILQKVIDFGMKHSDRATIKKLLAIGDMLDSTKRI